MNNKLFGLKKYLEILIELETKNKFPKILMLSGTKGQGKSTLIAHFLSYYFDKDNYNLENLEIKKNNKLFPSFKDKFNANIFYFNCINNNTKIDEIRKLRTDLQKTSINNDNQYVIFDDVEYLNENCVNALLKTIEEPSISNYFILINNKSKSMLDTLKSRSIELNIFLNNNLRVKIIEKLISNFNINDLIDYRDSPISPGNFVRFNDIVLSQEIDLNENIIVNIKKLFKNYKLKKNVDSLQLSYFLINQFYYKKSNLSNIDELNKKRSTVIKMINDSFKFNLNQSNLILELERNI